MSNALYVVHSLICTPSLFSTKLFMEIQTRNHTTNPHTGEEKSKSEMSSNSTSNSSTTITNRRGMTPSGSPHSKTFEDKRLDTTSDDSVDEDKNQIEPLLLLARNHHVNSSTTSSSSSPSALMIELGNSDTATTSTTTHHQNHSLYPQFLNNLNHELCTQTLKFCFCFGGLQLSYLTWGYMQELIMTTRFNPTPSSPDGKFPSAAFCVFSNRFLAVLVAMMAVKVRHGSIWSNNVAPLLAYTPCAVSNTISSWSQYASLRFVSFPVQTVFKSSKIIPVMIMGKILKGTHYPIREYMEAAFITIGVAIFSLASKSSTSTTSTQAIGLLYMIVYITADCFTSQWQDKVYVTYGKNNVDPYQMMLGVNTSAIIITTLGLLFSGDFPKVFEFFQANPNVFQYNIITAITSASGQLFIYYTIKEFGPIVFTIIMTVRQMISICISAAIFGHTMSVMALVGATLVFAVLFYQIWLKFDSNKKKKISSHNHIGGGGKSLSRPQSTALLRGMEEDRRLTDDK